MTIFNLEDRMDLMGNNQKAVIPLFLEIEQKVVKIAKLLGQNINIKIHSNIIEKKAKIELAFYPLSIL